MTKKELEMVEQLRTRLALRFTDDVLPDVAPPLSGAELNALSKGWMYVAAMSDYAARVEPACSSLISHSIGRVDQTITQRPIWLFSSEVKALRAMRNEVEKHAAKRLRRIDRLIDEAAIKELLGSATQAERAATTRRSAALKNSFDDGAA